MTWTKQCPCKATASTGQVRVSQAVQDHSFIVKAQLCLGPSCDECGAPWKKEPS